MNIEAGYIVIGTIISVRESPEIATGDLSLDVDKSSNMITDDKNEIGIVIECYDHDARHRILVVQSNDSPKLYQFFYLPKTPEVAFGDIVLMNFAKDKYSVHRGNSKLTYKLNPLVFPNTLLMELIAERMNL